MTNLATALGAVGALMGLVLFPIFFARALWAGRERDWVACQATILEARPWHDGKIAPGLGSYQVRARLAAADGREVSAWAEGTYVRAYSWVGTVRPAWHHPEEILRCRFVEPRGALVGFLRLLPILLVFAVVVAVFVGVAVLATR